MPITQFLHVSIGISDPEKSVPFYRDILGFKLITEIRYDKPGPAKVMGFKEADFTVWLMMRDGYRLELIHFDHPESEPLKDRPRTNSLGVSHLTVGIEDPEKTMAELKARGVKVWDHTIGNFEENAAGFMFLFEDPDGFLIPKLTWRVPTASFRTAMIQSQARAALSQAGNPQVRRVAKRLTSSFVHKIRNPNNISCTLFDGGLRTYGVLQWPIRLRRLRL